MLNEILANFDGEPKLLRTKFSLVCRHWKEVAENRLRHRLRKVYLIEVGNFYHPPELFSRSQQQHKNTACADCYCGPDDGVKALVKDIKKFGRDTRYLIFTCEKRSLMCSAFSTATPHYWLSLRRYFFPIFSALNTADSQLQAIIFSHLSTTVDDLYGCILNSPIRTRILLHNVAVAPLSKFQEYRASYGKDMDVCQVFHCVAREHLDGERMGLVKGENCEEPGLAELNKLLMQRYPK